MRRPHPSTEGPIDGFMHEHEYYRHVIFASDDDRIELKQGDKTILVFDSTGQIWVPFGTGRHLYGSLRMTNGGGWESVIDGLDTLYHENLLKLEVLVSKQYLNEM